MRGDGQICPRLPQCQRGPFPTPPLWQDWIKPKWTDEHCEEYLPSAIGGLDESDNTKEAT